jgi:hypothetical protein
MEMVSACAAPRNTVRRRKRQGGLDINIGDIDSIGRNQRNHGGQRALLARCRLADEFRAKATKCFERSKRAPDIEYQQLFRDLAVQWLAMAAEADASASIDPLELPPGDEGSGATACRIGRARGPWRAGAGASVGNPTQEPFFSNQVFASVGTYRLERGRSAET